MEHQQHHSPPAMSEVTYHHPPSEGTGRIWKTFWLLLVITIIELLLGLTMYWFSKMPGWLVMAIKGIIVILSLAKAFYIVSIFMHLGDELRNMIMTIIVPLMLFIWFIGAFLWDGNSYKNLRNTYDKHHREQSTKKVDKEKNEHDAAQPEHLQ